MSELLIHRLKLPLFIYDASPVLCPKSSPYSLLLQFFIVLEKTLQAQNYVFNSFGFHAENLAYLLCCQSQGRLVIISKNTQVPVTGGIGCQPLAQALQALLKKDVFLYFPCEIGIGNLGIQGLPLGRVSPEMVSYDVGGDLPQVPVDAILINAIEISERPVIVINDFHIGLGHKIIYQIRLSRGDIVPRGLQRRPGNRLLEPPQKVIPDAPLPGKA